MQKVVAAPVANTSSGPVIKRSKYEMCKNFREKGVCKYGDRCLFAHGDHELTRRQSDESKTESKSSSDKERESKESEDTIP